jgi:hypothetical protein
MNISPELKAHHCHITKQLTATKHIADMNEVAKRVLEVLDQCDALMRYIFRQFPKNRSVTREHGHFVDELLIDTPLAADVIGELWVLEHDVR